MPYFHHTWFDMQFKCGYIEKVQKIGFPSLCYTTCKKIVGLI